MCFYAILLCNLFKRAFRSINDCFLYHNIWSKVVSIRPNKKPVLPQVTWQGINKKERLCHKKQACRRRRGNICMIEMLLPKLTCVFQMYTGEMRLKMWNGDNPTELTWLHVCHLVFFVSTVLKTNVQELMRLRITVVRVQTARKLLLVHIYWLFLLSTIKRMF